MITTQKIVVKIITNSYQFPVKIGLDKTIRQLKHKLAYLNQNYDEIDKIQLFNRKHQVHDHQTLNQSLLDQLPQLELKICKQTNRKIVMKEILSPRHLQSNVTQLQQINEQNDYFTDYAQKREDNQLMNYQNSQELQAKLKLKNSKSHAIKLLSIKDNVKELMHHRNQLQFNNSIQSLPQIIGKKPITFTSQTNTLPTQNFQNQNNIDDILQQTHMKQVMPDCVYCNLQIIDEITSLQCLCTYHGECFDEIVNQQLDKDNKEIVCYRCTKPISNIFLKKNQQDELQNKQKYTRNFRFKHH